MAIRVASKRTLDVLAASAGLVACAPLLAMIAVIIRMADGGPVLFVQPRVGLHGREFLIKKFRTMRPPTAPRASLITAAGDPRVTPVGRFLRRTKLDELPQLWNVFTGDMSLVGPRPEVLKYVALYTSDQRRVLDLKPGMTDEASLAFRNEEELLAAATDPEAYYVNYCIPRKIELNLAYEARATVFTDVGVVLRTVLSVWGGRIAAK